MTQLEALQQYINNYKKLELVSYVETKDKYVCNLLYDKSKTVAQIPKAYTPGTQFKSVVSAIYLAIANVYINRGQYETAKIWLQKSKK